MTKEQIRMALALQIEIACVDGGTLTHIADLVMALTGPKPLAWKTVSPTEFYASNADYRVVTDGKTWAHCPHAWPPFGGYPYETEIEAKAAAQDSYNATHWANTPLGDLIKENRI